MTAMSHQLQSVSSELTSLKAAGPEIKEVVLLANKAHEEAISARKMAQQNEEMLKGEVQDLQVSILVIHYKAIALLLSSIPFPQYSVTLTH